MEQGNDDQLFHDWQNRLLSLIPHITAPFSLMGSSFIIFYVLNRGLWRNSPYDRIMLGLSTCDVLSSFAFVAFGVWAIPEHVDFVVGSRAQNFRACDVGGWFIQFYIGSILYTAALMIYFIVMVRFEFEWDPNRVGRWLEPCMHAVAISVPLVTAFYAVTHEFMNPFLSLPGICWMTPYPPDCAKDDNDDLECIRGEGSITFARISGGVVAFFTMLMVVVAMVLLFLKARSIEIRLSRNEHLNPTTTNQASERTRRIAIRGLCYIAAFTATCVPASIFQFWDVKKFPNLQFLVSLAIVIFIPLQGFFNAIIYFYPRWHELQRARHPIARIVMFLCSRNNAQPEEVIENRPNAPNVTNASNAPRSGQRTNNIVVSFFSRIMSSITLGEPREPRPIPVRGRAEDSRMTGVSTAEVTSGESRSSVGGDVSSGTGTRTTNTGFGIVSGFSGLASSTKERINALTSFVAGMRNVEMTPASQEGDEYENEYDTADDLQNIPPGHPQP